MANHPERREVVGITAEDDLEVIFALRDIIRPQHGKPHLGKLGEIERLSGSGRFVSLVPSAAHAQAVKEASPEALSQLRHTRELPDDIGTVFVTNVPGAPIQVIGRRDPANGELCVGSVILTKYPLTSEFFANCSPVTPEIVTGPEAERLILAVHEAFTRQADAENLTLKEFFERNGSWCPRTERRGDEVLLRDFQVCPTCRRFDGSFDVGRYRWRYCKTHKTKWIAACDLSGPEKPTDEQERRYQELENEIIGLGEFTYVGPDAEGYERAKRELSEERSR